MTVIRGDKAVKPEYPNIFNIRLTDDDMKLLNEMSEKLETPRSTLVRQVWRESLATQLLNPTV